jgi:hypothetical protein
LRIKTTLGSGSKAPFFDMNKELLRDFIISVLNDENGISGESFSILYELAEKDQSLRDIMLATDACDDRFYLKEEDAATFNK